MSANPKTVRLPFRALSMTVVELWLAQYLTEGWALDSDPGAGDYLASYRLNPEWIRRGMDRAGERNAARFLRRLIATGRRGGIGQAARPTPAPTPAPRAISGPQPAQPQPARRVAYEDGSKRILLDPAAAKRWLNEAGYFIAVQPTMKYYRQGRQLILEDSSGVVLRVLTMPETEPKRT